MMRNFLKSTPFLAIVACWLWSTAFVGVKIGLEYHTPFQFAGYRFMLAGFMLFIWFGNPRRYLREIMLNPGYIVLISFIQIFIQYALFYLAIGMVPGALGAMIVGASPLFIALVAHFTMGNDRMTPVKTLSILVGVAGIAIITLGRTTIQMRGELELVGIGLLILNNISSGFANVLVSRKSKGVSAMVLSSFSLVLGGVMLFLISIPLEGLHREPFPAVYYFSLGWLAFLSAAAFSIWFSLIQRPGVKVSELNVWKFLIPVSGAILSWIILVDEQPDIYSITGMLIIAASLLFLNFTKRK